RAVDAEEPLTADVLLRSGASAWREEPDTLKLAASRGSLPALERVAQTDPNAVLPGGGRPLHAAVQAQAAELVAALLARGADASARDASQATPLHLAARVSDPGFIRALVAASARADAVDEFGQTPLHVVRDDAAETHVPLLLAAGARLDAREGTGRTPAELAAAQGRLRAAEVLARHR
ncbi:MAG TPA: ankyrin repeat domain-containing protein, partial [Gemmatimonadales bacterium]|nr:ankyrin repeat domain-containing protein [Gemmatimonadales bacterium]